MDRLDNLLNRIVTLENRINRLEREKLTKADIFDMIKENYWNGGTMRDFLTNIQGKKN
jgi:hypothetical protein